VRTGWWAGKSRQFLRHLSGRVGAAERAELAGWLTPAQMALFESMHRADQRHGLDVVRSLRAAGHDQPEVLLAGLLHDSGKGAAVGLWHRVGWSLGERYGSRMQAALARLPGFAQAFDRIAGHAERSAELALAAGCSARTAELIRQQHASADDALGEALRLADEAN
jgi:hypothetical protein